MSLAPYSELSLAGLLDKAGQSLLRGVYTALPGIIDSYDSGTCKASVLPCVLEIADDGQAMPNQVIPSVPVIWPGSSNGFIRFPLSRGDGVLLVFSCRSTDEWRGNGDIVAPSDSRMHHMSDCVAVPGLFPFQKAQATPGSDDLFISFKDQSIIIRANGDVEIGKSVIIRASGDVEIGTGGSLNALVTQAFLTFFDTHVHASPDTPPSILTSTTPGAYQTTNTKAL